MFDFPSRFWSLRGCRYARRVRRIAANDGCGECEYDGGSIRHALSRAISPWLLPGKNSPIKSGVLLPFLLVLAVLRPLALGRPITGEHVYRNVRFARRRTICTRHSPWSPTIYATLQGSINATQGSGDYIVMQPNGDLYSGGTFHHDARTKGLQLSDWRDPFFRQAPRFMGKRD